MENKEKIYIINNLEKLLRTLYLVEQGNRNNKLINTTESKLLELVNSLEN